MSINNLPRKLSGLDFAYGSMIPTTKLKQELKLWIKDMEAEQPYKEHTKYVIIFIKNFIGEKI
ncbi:MAG: hypothetical protein WC758_07850 [Candidatus Woesearchaeota archaeon]|jgi:hypothetical protein